MSGRSATLPHRLPHCLSHRSPHYLPRSEVPLLASCLAPRDHPHLAPYLTWPPVSRCVRGVMPTGPLSLGSFLGQWPGRVSFYTVEDTAEGEKHL